MIDRQSAVNRSADVDQAFDDLVCEVSAKLEAGEAVDLDAIAVEHPEHADRLRKLLPTLEAMAELGHSDSGLFGTSAESRGPAEPKTGVLGDYRILREIGRGGMGVVYEAEQVSLGRKVALKVLPFAAMLDQRQLQRFQNEARAAASLRHPNIVQVHFVGCERAVHFYAMDYIEGQTLADLVHHLRGLEGLEDAGEGGGQRAEGGKAEDGKADDGAGSDLAGSLASGRFAPPKASSDAYAPTEAYTHERTPEDGDAVRSDRIHAVQPFRGDIDTPKDPMNRGTTNRTAQAAISTERSTKSPAYFRSIAQIGVQVAEALDHAHEHGVVHRDIKPSNVILDKSGKPWVTDFGLARIETDATLTVTGDLLGTVRYMSPEQALAKRIVVDHRTDVYSLGATLYELLTLQPVFTGQDRQELLRQIAFEDPKPPQRLNKAIPNELEIIVLKAMAKNPAERYDTAQELADDLRRFLEDRPIRARRPTFVQLAAKWSRRHKPIVWSAAISTFLLLVVGLVGLGIGNMMITKERDEKDQALVAKDDALTAKNAALKDKNEALSSAVANLLNAEAERRRAESNLSLALDALDTVYLRAIGRDRLLGDRDREDARRELSNIEKTLIEEGLDFYAQIATQNEDSTVATSETARAFLQIAMLQANLDDGKAADVAFVEAIARLKNLTESFPDNVDYFQQLGRAYYAKGNLSRWWPKADNTFAEAVDALSKAIDLSPSDASLFDLRAAAYERVSQYDKRLEDLLKAVQLQPANAKHHYALAGLFRFAPDPKVLNRGLALEHAQKAVELAPENATYHATLARYLSEAGRRQEALAVFGRAVSLDSGLADVFNQRSMVYRDAGRLEEALKDAEKAIELAPENAQHYRRRAETLKTLGRFEESLADFSVVERMDPNQRYLYSERGGLYLSRGQYSLALQDYDKALQLAPQWWWVYKRMAEAHFHLSQYAAALADLKKALELDPKDTSTLGWISPALVATCPDQSFRDGLLELAAGAVDKSPDPAGALQNRTALYLGLGEWKKGQADLEKAMESETANHYLYYQNALLCLILNEASKYHDACAAMVKKFGEADDPMAANFVAWTCALAPDAVDDYAPVLACATKAVEAKPDADQFLNSLGAILYRAGRHEAAIDRLAVLDRRRETADGAVRSSPAYTWYFLAMAHHKAGNAEQAQGYLNKANQSTDEEFADKENPPAWNRRATLELLRKEAEAVLGTDVQESAESSAEPDKQTEVEKNQQHE